MVSVLVLLVDDRGDAHGVEVFDLEVVDSAGAFDGFAFGRVLEIMKNCGTWASESFVRNPKSSCASSLKIVCSFTSML